jgi:mRNA degradation ribonuclease J1/J2
VVSGRVFLDARPETVGAEVVRDRRRLAEEGFIVVLLRGEEVAVVTRGVAADEKELSREITRAARSVISRAAPEDRSDPDWLRAEIALAGKRACRRTFGLRPVIVPVVV